MRNGCIREWFVLVLAFLMLLTKSAVRSQNADEMTCSLLNDATLCGGAPVNKLGSHMRPAKLICSGITLPGVVFGWYFKSLFDPEEQIRNDSKHTITGDLNECLDVKDLIVSDTGMYYCRKMLNGDVQDPTPVQGGCINVESPALFSNCSEGESMFQVGCDTEIVIQGKESVEFNAFFVHQDEPLSCDSQQVDDVSLFINNVDPDNKLCGCSGTSNDFSCTSNTNDKRLNCSVHGGSNVTFTINNLTENDAGRYVVRATLRTENKAQEFNIFKNYSAEVITDKCAGDPCPQDSRCFNTYVSYTCGCSVGYFYARSDNIGLNACIDVDECAFGENDCNKDATCTNTDGSFTCECDPGYTGDGRLCIPLDELCLCDGLDHCLLSTANLSRECTCDRGYYMHLNGTCIDINECNVTAYKDTLCEYGACENTEGSFICICSTGYMFDGNANCTDINECETDNDCHSVDMCENTIGSYECKCPENYFGDGRHCERGIQPVINTTTLHPTLPNMKLEYNIGTSFCIEDPVNASVQFTVTCRLKELGVPTPDLQLNISLNGTDLDSNNSDVSIMISSTNHYGNVTLNDTVIVDGTIQIDRQSPLIITCMVSNSYGDTTESTYIRLCDINECQDGVTNNCTQECTRNLTSGQHQCSCKLGFELVGDTTCKAMNECAVGPDFHNCSHSNNLTCYDLPPPERYRCVCKPGYHSFDGEDTCKDIDECHLQELNICSPYSECNNTVGSYTCECMSGTEKDMDGTCKDVNECDKGPGFHNCSSSDNRKCVNQPPPGQYACECVEGYQSPDGGDFCEDIDECSLSNYTCPSLTECRNTIGSYTCTPSKRFIIPVTLTAGFVVVIIIISVIIIVCYNRLKRTAVTILKRKPKRQEAVMNDQITEMATISRCVRMRGSISSKLSTLIIKSSNLQVKESIGQGEFGIVYKGYLTCYNNHKLVAIKTLKGFIGDGAVEELLQECARMADFKHLHVMTLLGVCLDGGPVPFLVLPYMSNGSLLTYLKKERHNLVVESEDEQLLVLTRKRLMDMCLQVAEGMEYLTTHKVVHRDLAARNCMIDMNRVIKVADFGLSVSTGSKLYFRMENATNLKLPVMWMAPESLMDYIFSEKSDIWSYGVTCWEVFSGGETPYTGVRPSSILRLLQNGERLEKTSNRACSSELYAMMLNCWEMEPDNRPNFSSIVNTLSESLEEMADYYNLGAFTELGSLD